MRKILVMDCEFRGSFWTTLGIDYKIFFAPTAERGLSMLSESIDLVFLSLNSLPDMDSIEVLDKIKREYPSKAVIVVASCGSEEPCMCMEAFRRGARDYVKKPLKTEEVRRKIEAVLTPGDGTRKDCSAALPSEAVEYERYPEIPSHLIKGVLRVRDFVAQNHTESLSLSDACKMAATSKTYFCRFFKRITGYSLRNYHHVVKVRKAEELLRDKRLSVADIASELGYNDSNYFSTIYKKITGAPPKSRLRTAAGEMLYMIGKEVEIHRGTLRRKGFQEGGDDGIKINHPEEQQSLHRNVSA